MTEYIAFELVEKVIKAHKVIDDYQNAKLDRMWEWANDLGVREPQNVKAFEIAEEAMRILL